MMVKYSHCFSMIKRILGTFQHITSFDDYSLKWMSFKTHGICTKWKKKKYIYIHFGNCNTFCHCVIIIGRYVVRRVSNTQLSYGIARSTTKQNILFAFYFTANTIGAMEMRCVFIWNPTVYQLIKCFVGVSTFWNRWFVYVYFEREKKRIKRVLIINYNIIYGVHRKHKIWIYY